MGKVAKSAKISSYVRTLLLSLAFELIYHTNSHRTYIIKVKKSMTEQVFDILKQRGFIAQVTDEEAIRKMLNQGQVTVYNGYDPTADSLHVGHLVTIMALMHLQQAGHRPIGLVGCGTTMIGDPSGKTELRQMMTEEKIRANGLKIQSQLNHYLDFDGGQAIYVDNSEWLLELNYVQFLCGIGRHFSVNRMLAAEAYKQRLEKGLNFIEFNYQLLQAYDYLLIYQKYNCTMQLGGDDQWGNLLAGVDLIRRKEGATVHAMTYPLLTKADGSKMGKTAAGAVWLSADRLSPYNFYQFWMNCDDQDVEKLLKIFTFLPLDEIERLSKLQGAEIRQAKQTLAFEATKITHDEAEAKAAVAASKAAFAKGGNIEAMPSTAVAADRLQTGMGILEIFTEVGLTNSRSEARRLLTQGGVYVNEQRIEQAERALTVQDIQEESILLRVGKKKYHRLVVAETGVSEINHEK